MGNNKFKYLDVTVQRKMQVMQKQMFLKSVVYETTK